MEDVCGDEFSSPGVFVADMGVLEGRGSFPKTIAFVFLSRDTQTPEKEVA